jgi:hypothetical protein
VTVEEIFSQQPTLPKAGSVRFRRPSLFFEILDSGQSPSKDSWQIAPLSKNVATISQKCVKYQQKVTGSRAATLQDFTRRIAKTMDVRFGAEG